MKSQYTKLVQGDRSIPLYVQVEMDLRRKVSAGEWAEGTPLPGRSVLAKEYGVNLTTLQQAIASLIADGTLRTDRRRGTFVGRSTGLQERSHSIFSPVSTEAHQAATINNSLSHLTVGVMGHLQVEEGDVSGTTHWPSIIHEAMCQVLSMQVKGVKILNSDLYDSVSVTVEKLAGDLAEAKQAGIGAIVAQTIYTSTINTEKLAMAALFVDMPIVLITFEALPLPILQVFYDQQMAGYQAAQHLIRTGYRRLMALAPMLTDWADARIAGMAHAVRVNGLQKDAFEIWPLNRLSFPLRDEGPPFLQYQTAGFRSLQPVSREKLHGLGIIALNDAVAVGAMQSAMEQGLTMGRDYGLVGFDDMTEAQKYGITSARPPCEVLGTEAAKLLLRSLRGEDDMLTQVRLRSHLIPRRSTVL